MKAPSSSAAEQLAAEILRLTSDYAALAHEGSRMAGDQEKPFVPGESTVPYAGRVFSAEEVVAAVNSSLEFWLTLGREGEAMERELASHLNVKRSILVNSGSSANLLAVAGFFFGSHFRSASPHKVVAMKYKHSPAGIL